MASGRIQPGRRAREVLPRLSIVEEFDLSSVGTGEFAVSQRFQSKGAVDVQQVPDGLLGLLLAFLLPVAQLERLGQEEDVALAGGGEPAVVALEKIDRKTSQERGALLTHNKHI
jgi:hypothetical protein